MWDIEYRPKLFSEVRGQEGSIAVLKARLRNGTAMDTSYIFAGGSGTGKTTTARIFARAMICTSKDPETQEPCNVCDNCLGILNDNSLIFTEKDAASQGTIDHVRRIVDDLAFATLGGEKRIYLLDEAHAISKASQDLLLKSIEEKRLVVFFCTTEPEKIRGAIRSRCEEHHIRKSSREDLFALGMDILRKENISPVEEDAVYTVVDASGGHVRDTINKLETIAQLGEGVTQGQVSQVLNLSSVNAFYQILLLLPTDVGGALKLLSSVEQKVSADEAAAGLAEVAMNAFRYKHGLLAEFTYLERGLATSISDIYGDFLVKVASSLVSSRFISWTTLIADLVLLAREFGGSPIKGPPPSRYVEVKESTPVVTSPATAAGGLPTTAVAVQSANAPTVVNLPAPSVQTVVQEETSKLRKDGVGNLGSSDPLALTIYDNFVVPERSTGKRNKDRALAVQVKPLPGREVLSSEVWRAMFEDKLRSIRGTK